MRVPMRQESYYPHTMLGAPAPPEPAFKSAIPGLTVLTPEPDATALRYQAAADVARDLHIWKAATAAWQEEYMSARSGPDARNAVQEVRAFNEEQFKPLQEKYANNPTSMRYLHGQGSSISNRSIGFMSAYARGENEHFVTSVLAEEEKELRGLMTSRWSSEQDRKQAFVAYTFKAENWRLDRGKSPEEVKAWKGSFSHDLVSEALHARFDRILAQDPDQALTLIRIAKGEDAGIGASGGKKGAASLESPTGEMISPAPLNGAAQGNPEGDQGQYAQLRKMASEYTTIIPAQQLQLMQNRAEAEKQNRLRLTEERTSAIHSGVEATMLRAVDGGDLASLRAMEDELTIMGKTADAQSVTAMRETMAQAQPYLASSRFEPFTAQRNGLGEFFARPEMNGGTLRSDGAAQFAGNDTVMGKTLAVAERGIAERESRFLRDPAGYAATHPLLGREGLNTEDFCKQAGITQEDHITRSLQFQEHMGQNMDMNPRVLPEARAAEIKDQYDGLGDPQKKAELLRQLAASGGKYATRMMAEAGLPMGATAFAQILLELSMSEATKLVGAAGMTRDSRELGDERKAEIRQRVAESPLVKALLAVDSALSGSGTDGALSGADPQTGKPGVSAQETIHALESFVALGGNLPDLERRVVLANTRLAKDIAANIAASIAANIPINTANTVQTGIIALASGAGQASVATGATGSGHLPAESSSTEMDKKPQRSSWEQQAHGFGVGTRGVMDGVTGAADFVATPMRALLNGVNWLFGGDPNYFKPVGSNVSNALNLPQPENQWEEIAHAINKGGTEAICTVWGASALMAQKAATSAGGTVWDVLNVFKIGPAAQVTSGAGAELGVLAAQKAGAGPAGTIAAGLAGAVAGGKVTPGGAPTLAARAEAKAARAAERSITKKTDMFVLTPETITQAVEKSSYTKHAGQVLEIEAKELGWSQTTVSYRKIRELPDGQKIEYTYDDIKADLHNNGWPKDEPIDVVIMPPSGKLTSIDNTRLTVVHELGGVDKYGRPIKPEVRVRRPDEVLSIEEKLRFTRRKETEAQTWGDIARERIRNQSPKIPGQEYRLEQPPRVTGRPK